MPAPPFFVRTREGDTFALDDAGGRYLVLEFYHPFNETFLRELPERNIVFGVMNPVMFQTLSVSMEEDQDINEALFEEIGHAGLFAFPGPDLDVIKTAYNVHVLPTRFLIDPEGIIVAKYSGFGLRPLEEDLVALVAKLQTGLSTR